MPLSSLGVEQARAIAERLAELPIVHCFCSDLSRAYDTATAISQRLGILVEANPDLREANKGELEGLHRDPESGLIGDETRTFDENDVAARPPGGESMVDLRVRCQRFVARLIDQERTLPDGDLLLVTHGGTMRAMMTVLLDLPVESSRSFHFDNCGLTTIERHRDRPAILRWYTDCQQLGSPARV